MKTRRYQVYEGRYYIRLLRSVHTIPGLQLRVGDLIATARKYRSWESREAARAWALRWLPDGSYEVLPGFCKEHQGFLCGYHANSH